VGGGAGDTLQGCSSADFLVAASGNETLIGGSGHMTFDLLIGDNVGTLGSGTTDTIFDFDAQDILKVGNSTAVDYALSTYEVVGNNGTFLLQDGTRVILEGFTGPLTHSDVK
jgi:Ca2+-binding RTX toxin-like protein